MVKKVYKIFFLYSYTESTLVEIYLFPTQKTMLTVWLEPPTWLIITRSRGLTEGLSSARPGTVTIKFDLLNFDFFIFWLYRLYCVMSIMAW